ncbi:MAG: hypothetical protein JNL01_02670 [Bdellovibrionales bacterium]|nr:hypothetical protein [Bdellovibrionales bacterium]
MNLIRLALRELRIRGNQKMFSFFFVLNLSFGLFAFLTVVSLKLGLERAISEKSRESVGADLAVSARRDLTQEELKVLQDGLPKGSRASRTVQIFSMIRPNGQKRVRLAQIKGMPDDLPFAGSVELRVQGKVRAPFGGRLGQKVWIDQALSRDLGIERGGKILLGGKVFDVDDVIVEDSNQGSSFSAMGAKVMIGLGALEKTGLVGLGSISTRTWLAEVPMGQRSTDELQKLEDQLNQKLEDPAIRVRSHTNSAQESSRLFQYLSDYLGLVSLAALALSAFGVIFQFRRYLSSKIKGLAVLRSLGASSSQVLGIPLIQVLFLGTLSGLLAGWAAQLAAIPLEAILEPLSPYPFRAVWASSQWVLAIAVGTLGAAFFVIPELLRLLEIPVSELFRESRMEKESTPFRPWAYLPMLFGWTALAVMTARSWKVGLLFSLAVLFTGFLVAVLGRWVTRWASLISFFQNSLVLRIAFRRMTRSPGATRLAMITVGVSTMLMNLLPQLRNGIESELADQGGSGGPGGRPALFLFDIQDEQKQGVDHLVEKSGMTTVVSSPFIRSRLLSINGKAFEKEQVKNTAYRTREDEQEQGLRNRGINLSYRQRLTESETLVSGREFTETYKGEGPAEVSIEKRFADRLGLRLGDLLKFDIQGVDIDAKIVNFRRVRWSSFLPNFFVQFQEGVLNETPKTFLNALRGPEEAKNRFLDQLIEKFPNVSAVDVSEALRIFRNLVDQIRMAITWMAGSVLIAGVMTLSAMVRYDAASKTWQMNLFRVLGGTPKQVFSILALETVWVAFVGSLVGASLGFLVSFSFTVLVFEGEPAFSAQSAGVVISISVFLGLALAWIFGRGLSRRHPREILHQEGS